MHGVALAFGHIELLTGNGQHRAIGIPSYANQAKALKLNEQRICKIMQMNENAQKHYFQLAYRYRAHVA